MSKYKAISLQHIYLQKASFWFFLFMIFYVTIEKINDKVVLGENISNFKKEAWQIFLAIKKNDLKTFLKFCSKDGILVVERYWDCLGKVKWPIKELSLSNTITWVERQMRLDRKDLKSKQFIKIFKEFSEIVQGTFAGPWFDLDTIDAWRSRRLGPAIEGKVASNAYWYVYLVREGGKWKVWRLEITIH